MATHTVAMPGSTTCASGTGRGPGARCLTVPIIAGSLAVVELQEEGERKKGMLVLAATAGVFLTLGALLFAIFIVVVFWDTHRIAAAAVMTLLYLGIGAYALMQLKHRASSNPPPFAATLEELKRDVDALRGSDE